MHIMKDVKDMPHTRGGYHYTDGWGRSWRWRDFDIAINSALWGVVVTLAIVWVVG